MSGCFFVRSRSMSAPMSINRRIILYSCHTVTVTQKQSQIVILGKACNLAVKNILDIFKVTKSYYTVNHFIKIILLISRKQL